MSEKGFIKLYRKSLDNPIFNQKPFDYWHAWEDILLNVNYERTERFYKNKMQVTEPGQMQTSIKHLAERWGWSPNKVRRFLVALETANMCTRSGTPDGTTLTVEKWAFYQVRRQANGTANETTNETTDGTHNKNIKNIKKGAAPEMAKKPSGGAMRIGDIITDSDGFQYIKKTDGSLDRYRGGGKK